MNEPDQRPETPPEAQGRYPMPPQPQSPGQWVFVPAGQSFTLGTPAIPAVPGYAPQPLGGSVGVRIAAGIVALSNLIFAVPGFIYVMFFVYDEPMTPGEGWFNFFVLVAIIGYLVTGIRIIAKHRRPSAGSTPWTLGGFALLNIIGFLGLTNHYPPLSIGWGVLTGIAVIMLCLSDLAKTAQAQPLTAPNGQYEPTVKG